MDDPAESLLDQLVGAELYEVIFVMDYLQIGFQGDGEHNWRLNLYCWPAVETPAGPSLTFGTVGYRDALCGLITVEVAHTRESAHEGLLIGLGEHTLRLKPRVTDLSGPEIALMDTIPPGGGRWMVWRPGEFPFEELAE